METPRQEKVDFNRDVRPILSENRCVCHGLDPGSRIRPGVGSRTMPGGKSEARTRFSSDSGRSWFCLSA